MPSGFTITPIGAHTSNGTLSSAITPSIPTGANVVLLVAYTQAIRYTLDGTTPTSTTGFRVPVQTVTEIALGRGAVLKIIEETASASVQYQFGRMIPISGTNPALT